MDRSCGSHGAIVRGRATVTAEEGTVVTDSVPWKDDLIRAAERLEARAPDAAKRRTLIRTVMLDERASSCADMLVRPA